MDGGTATSTRVIIVEDEPLYRDLLRSALVQDPLVDVVGVFGDGPSALEAAGRLRPQIALLDIELGGEMNGVQLGVLLRRRIAGLGVVLLSNHAAPRFLASLGKDDLSGWAYLLKRSVRNASVLSHVIRSVGLGLVALDPLLVANRTADAHSFLSQLTPRQLELLELLAQGWTNEAIANRMSLTTKTVENQLSQLYSALGLERAEGSVHQRVQAVLLYLRETHQSGLWDPLAGTLVS